MTNPLVKISITVCCRDSRALLMPGDVGHRLGTAQFGTTVTPTPNMSMLDAMKRLRRDIGSDVRI